MIDLKFKDETYSLKTSISEFTIDEFEDICVMINANTSKYEKCISIFLRLGIDINLIANMDSNDIFNIMKEFDFDYSKCKIQKTITLNKTIYSCYDKSFKLTVKNMLLIESYIKINPKKYFGEVLAILYTNSTCKLSINDKAKLIRETIPAEIALPIVYEITKSMIDNLKFILND